MTSKTAALRDPGIRGTPEEAPFRVGRIVEVTEEGSPIVDFPGAPSGGVAARVAAMPPHIPAKDQCVGLSVLLLLEEGDPERPIITGILRDTLEIPSPAADPWGNPAQALKVNGKTLLLEGEQEIVLRCGLGSITIRADGKITLKGTRLMSRASETNKVRGASVLIN